MIKFKCLILGGGVSGLAAAKKLRENNHNHLILESRGSMGGLLDNFSVKNFLFDHAVHLSFANEKVVRTEFDKHEYYTHSSESLCYDKGRWLKHPVQNNLFKLSIDEKITLINSFYERPNEISDLNYKEWLYSQYGVEIAEKYPIPYTKKYWDISPELLSTSWIGNRMRKADASEILRGSYTDQTPNDYYTKEMRYPEKGGYKKFLQNLIEEANYEVNKKIISIDLESKIVKCEDGTSYSYEYLISSIPLPEMVRLCVHIPDNVKQAGNNLLATSVDLVSIGFNKHIDFDKIWFYIYDPEIFASRAYWASKKSSNNAPKNKSSIQFEAYSLGTESKYDREILIDNTLNAIEKFGFASKEDVEVIDHRRIKYGNVVFYKGMEQDRLVTRKFFESNFVQTIGRFGEWEYLWSNQAFISGYNVEI